MNKSGTTKGVHKKVGRMDAIFRPARHARALIEKRSASPEGMTPVSFATPLIVCVLPDEVCERRSVEMHCRRETEVGEEEEASREVHQAWRWGGPPCASAAARLSVGEHRRIVPGQRGLDELLEARLHVQAPVVDVGVEHAVKVEGHAWMGDV